MKNKIFLFTIIMITLVFISACEKNEHDPSFKAQARLLISGSETEGARADSIGFTFAIWPTSLTDTQITVIVQSMGNIVDKDRQFSIGIDAANTTALPEEYALPATFTLPANAFKTSFLVTIKRAARLKDISVQLVLTVQENENFLPGPVLGGTVNAGPAFRITWTEVLTQPAVWNSSMLFAVGKWSRVKHQAIIDVTGIRNYEGLGFSKTYAIASVMLDWLNAYNASHPGAPLLDEKGEEVKICSQCN